MAVGDASAPRNRLAVAGARATTEAMLREQPRGDVIRNAIFAGLLLLAVTIALAGLLALLIQAFVGEAVEGIEHAGLRDALMDEVVAWLAARK